PTNRPTRRRQACRCGRPLTPTTRDLGPKGHRPRIRGRLGRRLLGNLVARAGKERRRQSLLPRRATNGLKSLVFSLRTAIAGWPAGGKKLPPEPPESA